MFPQKNDPEIKFQVKFRSLPVDIDCTIGRLYIREAKKL